MITITSKYMKLVIKLTTFLSLLFVVPVAIATGKISNAGVIDKTTFYGAMASGKTAEVDAMLAEIEKSSLSEKEAYAGALTIRKAGLTGNIKDKLNFFKTGRTRLEAAIKSDEGNVEYHFLRLIIQENAPKIAKYRSDLKTDGDMVRNSFKKLNPDLRQIIKDYSKKSKVLKPAEL